MEDRREFGRDPFLAGPIRRTANSPAHARAAGDGPCRPGRGRDSQGDAVEPAPDRFLPPHGAGPADEDQEGGLEGVLGVVLVAQDRAADAEDHRPVPLHQGGERRSGRIVIVPRGRSANRPSSSPSVSPPVVPDVEERPDVLEQSSSPIPRCHADPPTVCLSCAG